MLVDINSINRLAASAGPLVFAILWQSALLAAVVALLALGLRRSAPSLRYWLWQIVAIKLLLMPFWISALNIDWPVPPIPVVETINEAQRAIATNVTPATTATHTTSTDPAASDPATTGAAINRPLIAEAPATTAATPPPPTQPALSWPGWLLLAWVAIVLLQCLQLIYQRHRLRNLLSSATTGDSETTMLVQQIGLLLSLKRAPRVLLTTESCSPFVHGLLCPRLVLPKALLSTLSAAQLRQVVLHELAHLRRRDLIWCWIPQIARMLFFFNPVTYLVQHRTRLESELACDQIAMQADPGTPADYVQTLVTVMSQISEPPSLQRSSAS